MLTSLEWTTISDFTPGIHTTGLNQTPLPSNRITVPAPLGAAQSANTYRCIGLPGGGLGPLPKMVASTSLPIPDTSNGTLCINGFRMLGSIVNTYLSTGISMDAQYEIHFSFAWNTLAGASRFRWYRCNDTATFTFTQVVDKTGPAASMFKPMNVCWFTPAKIGTLAAANPLPSMVASWWNGDPRVGGGFFWVFPDANNLSGTTPTPYETTTKYGGAFAHQSRVILMHPEIYAHGGSHYLPNNEKIQFTDPPLSGQFASPDTFLSGDSADGFGAIGSVSSGELFLVRKRGGALVVLEDVVYPRVVRLPGITSTGPVTQEGVFCSKGLVYCVYGDGVYIWDGSNTSRKISKQRVPDFYLPTSIDSSFGPPSGTGFGIDIFIPSTRWMDWVLLPHNNLWDPTTESWWRLEDVSIIDCQWFTGGFGAMLYGCKNFLLPGDANNLAMRRWDSRIPANSYSWQSQPIPASIGAQVDIREVELLAKPTNNTGSVTVTLTDSAGVTKSLVFTFKNNQYTHQPERIIKTLPDPFIGDNIIVRIEATSGDTTSGAPIVFSLSLGYHRDRISQTPWS